MSEKKTENLYLLLDSKDMPLARGTLEGPNDAPQLHVRVMDEMVDEVSAHHEIKMVGMLDNQPALLGRILRVRNDALVVEKLQALGNDFRQNFRMPVDAVCFIYPLTGAWSGRCRVRTVDISCSGIAFFYEDTRAILPHLKRDEEIEIAVSVTQPPLVLRCRILREREGENGRGIYSAAFKNQCHDEEKHLREAIFGMQVRAKAKRIQIINQHRGIS